MGYVILKKGAKAIRISESLFKFVNFYVSFKFGKEAITFCDCRFEKRTFSFENQKVEFLNCFFSNCDINLDNSDLFSNSIFEMSILNSNAGNITIKFNPQDLNSSFYLVRGNKIKLEGNSKLNALAVVSDSVECNGANLQCNMINMAAKNLMLNNNFLISKNAITLKYDELYFRNTSLKSETGIISFINGEDEIVYNVSGDLILNDAYLLDEKNMDIYSLISILKGYNNHINTVNATDISNKRLKIYKSVTPLLNDIEGQIKVLRDKKKAIELLLTKQMANVEDKYQKRKVKVFDKKRNC